MIRYIAHQQIDFEKWDDCIDRSINGIFYAYSWYLDMTAPGWDALVEDDYQTVMPLPNRKRLGVRFIYQPFFVQQLGVFSSSSLTPEVTARFLDAIPPRFRFVDLNLNTFNRLDESSTIKRRQGITHHLDLIESYEQLAERYSSNTRRNIRKAQKQGVFITAHGRPEEVIQAFRENRGKGLNTYREHDYHILKHLIYVGLHKGMATLMSAYTAQNNFCGAIVFFRSHKKTVFLFSGATPASRENGAMFLLVDEFIKQQAGQNLVLDFEGSSDPDLARFYKGFGSKECAFLQVEMNRMPGLFRQGMSFYRRLRSGGKGR
ncbi:MAG: hypothetical protein V2I46_14535 [Bacteroides sp.]|jgi:hypothetical protein|nr:hypothetical protein [Bacteroides sp.]